MARTSLRETVNRLQAANDKFESTLVRIRDIAKAGHLLANRWAIVAAINICLTEARTGLPDIDTLMVRDGLLPPILGEPDDTNAS